VCRTGRANATAYISQSTVCATLQSTFQWQGANGIDPGSAPDIAGKGVVNPVAAILSPAMMMLYSFNLPDEAKAIEEAVKRTIESGVSTKDIGGSSSASEVGDRVAKELETILSA